MHSSTLFQLAAAASTVFAQTTGQLGDAKAITNNPAGKQIVGTLPAQPFFKAGSLNGNVKGSVTVKSGANGAGVDYTIKFSNLPKEGGPFLYHIHDKAVPENGNCTATAAHLDPYLRGEATDCDSSAPKTCQTGDLSGKYGKINSDPFEVTYHDDFASLNLGNNGSIPDRSFVVHFANKTRITCANFVVTNPGSNSTTPYPTGGSPTGTPKPTSTVPVQAGSNMLSVGAQTFAIIGLAGLYLVV